MIDERALYRTLGSIYSDLKANHHTVSMLMSEIAAVRDALKEVSPDRFLPAFEKYQQKHLEESERLRSTALAAYDEIIRRVKLGQLNLD